ncbi:hypothetical protein H310_07712 [Aphanomyces invadans]|uniref:DDE Tnp4 domain-containing protein n=1 Tax=Aphanomyces invadans TaxID=157072 RepID=A0A024U052_9STRA|nr:hypothetical protein H310_07712 [Aphanomyces invadans]ETV99643.1 hypothetical protein H310_07712 [Aphanomyces invadans]|eukprot:XP_008871419.1 hypothetical protein H310_07712 [Aphanomyces invadans]
MPINSNAILNRLQDQVVRDQTYLESCFDDFGETALQRNLSDEAPANPIMDKFVSDLGSEGIRTMTNFTVSEFEALWAMVDHALTSAWLEGRGRRSPTSPKDAFFMTLIVLKYFCTWDKHAADFGYKAPTFEKLIMRVIHNCKANLKKTPDDMILPDHGELAAEYRSSWACLVDMGYIGVAHALRGVHPKRRPANGFLDAADLERNRRVSSDRVVVENYFGRVCMLWKIYYSTYTWGEKNYNVIQRASFALSNYHLTLMPLRAEVERFYALVLTCRFTTTLSFEPPRALLD